MPRLLYHLAFVQCSLLEHARTPFLFSVWFGINNPKSFRFQIYKDLVLCGLQIYKSAVVELRMAKAWFGLATLPGPTMHPNGLQTRSTKARMFLHRICRFKMVQNVQLLSTAARCRLLLLQSFLFATYWPSTHKNCRFFDFDEMLLWLHRISFHVLQPFGAKVR